MPHTQRQKEDVEDVTKFLDDNCLSCCSSPLCEKLRIMIQKVLHVATCDPSATSAEIVSIVCDSVYPTLPDVPCPTPAPRLVGIELNPGPASRNPLVASIVGQVVSKLASTKKKKGPTKPKSSKKKGTVPTVKSLVSYAPQAIGKTYIQSAPPMRRTEEFHVNALRLQNTATGYAIFNGNFAPYFTVANTTGFTSQVLVFGQHATAAFFTAQNAMLGFGNPTTEKIFSTYSHYQLRDLSIELVPLRAPGAGNSANGSIAMSFVSDAGILNASAAPPTPSYGYVASCSNSITCSTWEGGKLKVPNSLLKGPKYCSADYVNGSTAQSAPTDGQLQNASYGAVHFAPIGWDVVTANIDLFSVRVSAKVDFYDFSDGLLY
jgi:hypothetical protein